MNSVKDWKLTYAIFSNHRFSKKIIWNHDYYEYAKKQAWVGLLFL